MKELDILQRTIGLQLNKEGAGIRLWAPLAKKATLHLESRGLTIPLQQEAPGYWYTTTREVAPGDLYRFSIDDGNRLPDPASLSQPSGVHGPSQAVSLDFPWSDQQWQNPALGDYIIYELHTGTFSGAGLFKDITDHLDHLVALGITAIELMPVAQFPGARNWGYDGVYPFAVQQSYGGTRALQQLVDACHARGLAVILDVVYNHLGPEGNYFAAYGPYFTEKYKTPWGSAINFDDAYCDPVRRYVIENALMWLRDFHIDALRLDAVHAIKDYSPKHIIQEMNETVKQYNEATGADKYLILESDLNDSRFIRPLDEGGFDVKAQWCDEFHHALRVAVGQERIGYYADFKGVSDLALSLENGYVFTGQYASERHRTFGTSTTGISGDHFIVFAQNHDQVGNRMLGERVAQLNTREQQKLLAAVVLTAPFVPLLFMGEEWGAETPFLYFTDHSDSDLIAAVENGRKQEFAHFQQQGTPAPANDEATFRRSRLDWDEQELPEHKVMLEYYTKLIQIRKTHQAMRHYDRSATEVLCEADKGIVILQRAYKEQRIYCLFNFSEEPREIKLHEEVFPLQVLLSSSDKRWLGKEDSYLQYDHQTRLTVQPHAAILLANYHVSA